MYKHLLAAANYLSRTPAVVEIREEDLVVVGGGGGVVHTVKLG